MMPKDVAEVMEDHVALESEGIDRMYLYGHTPSLQTGAGLAHLSRGQQSCPIPSTVMIAPMSKEFVATIERFVKAQGAAIRRPARSADLEVISSDGASAARLPMDEKGPDAGAWGSETGRIDHDPRAPRSHAHLVKPQKRHTSHPSACSTAPPQSGHEPTTMPVRRRLTGAWASPR